MAYLLDTNIVSALRRPERLEDGPRRFLDTLNERNGFVSVMTILEIETGILQKQRVDAKQGARLRIWFETWRRTFPSAHVLPITEGIAIRCAGLHIPNPRPAIDALIAATAVEHSLTLVTRNVTDFRSVAGCRTLDPWSE